MQLTITEIRDLLQARIRTQLPYLTTVEGFQGQINEKNLEEGQIVITTPAVLICLDERASAPLSHGEDELNYDFTLVIACRNLRGREAARREDGGVEQILEDLYRALHNYELNPALQPVEHGKDKAFFVTREWAIYFATYNVKQEVEND